MSPRLPQATLALAILLQLGAVSAWAADFNTTTLTDTAAKTLGTASGQTGTVTATGALTVSGSTVAVTISGNNATLTNLGSIKQTGTGRVVRDNTGVSNLVINNGSASNSSALMQAADADVIQMNKSPASVTLNNYGIMRSLNASAGGAQVVDFNAILSGPNVVNNYFGALMQASEADAVRPGVNGVVNNAGTIKSTTTTGSSSDGVDLQSNSGVQINNAATGLIEGGRSGIAGGADSATTPFIATISNIAGGVIRGNNGSGINLDGFNANQVISINNAGTITGNGVTGDGDGVDVDGLVHIVNSGIIRSINAVSALLSGPAYSEGISVGGGTIVNSGTIEGLVAAGNTNAVGRGITLVGNDITSGALAGTREAIYGNTTVTNNAGGLIRGDSDSAIVVGGPASGFLVTINNLAGAIMRGGGALYAAVRSGADNDTLVNAGLIDGSSSGKAIDLGAGDNSIIILGGSASVLGNINGGVGGSNTLTIDPGTGKAFVYEGIISNVHTMEVKSGTVTFSGQSDYSGTTLVSGGTLVLEGAQRLSASSALAMNGGTLSIQNAGSILDQVFASLSLLDDSVIHLRSTALTFMGLGDVVAGKSLSVLDDAYGATPDSTIRFIGDFSQSQDFLALMSGLSINQRAVSFYFDGIYTDVRMVPEPGTTALMLAGLAMLGAVTRRRKAKALAA